MLRVFLFAFAIICFISCNNNNDVSQGAIIKDSMDLTDSIEVTPTSKDNVLMSSSTQVLRAIKERNFTALSQLISADKGLRLSPYGFVDTATDIKFTRQSLLDAADSDQKLIHFIQDGSGKKMAMTVAEYFDRYVYDKDYIRAEDKAINEVLSKGNSLNNLSSIFPGSDFTEYYVPGSDKKAGGLDWKSLRLVFVNASVKPELVAIVHDEWTP